MSDGLSRRAVLRSLSALAIVAPLPAWGAAPSIRVVKDPNCGCCSAWMAILAAEGFNVAQVNVGQTELQRFKALSGVPEEMASCHTAIVEGYVIEGHVPVADMRRLLAERPAALGLAVPGMPNGSPGMGPESEREAYDVFLMHKDGSVEVFNSYAAA